MRSSEAPRPENWDKAPSPSVRRQREGVTNLYSMKADGSDIKRLVTPAGTFSLSPDGKKILYIAHQSDRFRSLQIVVADPEGGDGVRLTSSAFSSVDPCWSSDGTKIYFGRVTDVLERTVSLFQMDADGKNVRRLTSEAAFDRNPTVSPDGSRIAFQSNRHGNVEIYVLSLTVSKAIPSLSEQKKISSVSPTSPPPSNS